MSKTGEKAANDAASRLLGLSTFAKVVHSIRTRTALVTGAFLLMFLLVFYLGGRCVLANLVEDTERQVREVGTRMTALAQRQAEDVMTSAVAAMNRPDADTADARALLLDDAGSFSFVARFTSDGTLIEGLRRAADGQPPLPLAADDFAAYTAVLHNWIQAVDSPAKDPSDPGVGILRIGGHLHGSALLRRGDEFVLFGLPLSAEIFTNLGKDQCANLEVRVCGPGNAGEQASARPLAQSAERSRFGISPMFTESRETAEEDLSFWRFRLNPLDAMLVLRDISGNAVSVVSVSLPQVFLGATRMAVWQLAFFVAFCGILFVLPIFWMQGRLLLNPLTRMTRSIAALSEHAPSIDCPRIVWDGKDEFALLAESVNRLVEAIAAKTVSLANIEASHQALIACVPDALVIFDPQGRMVSVSKQPEGVPELPWLRAGEPPLSSSFSASDLAAFRRVLKTTFRTGEVGRIRLSMLRPAGAPPDAPTRHFEARLTRMSANFALAIVRDVSAEFEEHERRLAAEARALDVSKRESLTGLAAGIAHDMNNVLSVILNVAEAGEADPSGDTERLLGTIRDAVRRGTAMMNELRAFAGENPMTFMRASPQIVLEDVRPLVNRVVSPNVEVSFEVRPGLLDVDVDLNQFWKVLFNIVKNAGEAIGELPGHVSLCVYPFRMTRAESSEFVSEHPLPDGPGSVFEVSDDGPGIPEEFVNRIFDPYVSSKSFGRGLGLATVRTIIEAHGGGISVRSQPGCGTTFRVFLPASKLSAETAKAGVEDSASDLSGEVLLVDDDEMILKTTCILCKTLGLGTYLARDRREALSIVRRHAAQLKAILLDAHLGQIDTVRLLGAFRIGAPDIPVVVASGSMREDVEKMFRAHPFDVFLPKPYTLDELKRALSRARDLTERKEQKRVSGSD